MMEHFDAAGWSYSKGSFRVEMNASFNVETNNITLEMTTEQSSPEIRYTTDGSDPDNSSAVYEGPLPLSASATVRAAIFKSGKISGKISEKKVIIHKATGKPVKYNLPFSDKYKALGETTLVNGIMGSGAFDDGQWQGFDGSDLDIVIDLGSVTTLTKVSTRFKAATGSWIFLPRWVEISLSEDGNTFLPPHRIDTSVTPEDQGNETLDYFTTFLEGKARLVRVAAGSQGICPPWHPGAGGKVWMFCDEVVVE
jgi:hexosaminidase